MNQSTDELQRKVRAMEKILLLLKPLAFFGYKKKELKKAKKELNKLKKGLRRLNSLTKDFNSLFTERGWIAYDNLSLDLMESAIRIYRKNGIEKAEEYLTQYFLDDNLDMKVMQLSGLQHFKSRMSLIKLAVTDSVEERYHSSIPIILMMIDGVVNDIEQTGFFTEKTDLSAWDSITASDDNLKKLSTLFGAKRNRTNNDAIDVPYRNGILHGRDLNYYNRVVAAKTWLALFAVADFVKNKVREPIRKKEYLEKKKQEGDFTFQWGELKGALDKYSSQKKRHIIQDELVKSWSPRLININEYIASNYPENSPEYAVVRFMEKWKEKNFGYLADSLSKMFDDGESKSKKAGKLRRTFLRHRFHEYRILEIEDQSPAITQIKVEISLEKEKDIKFNNYLTHNFRLVYLDSENHPIPRGIDDGYWKIVDSFYRDI